MADQRVDTWTGIILDVIDQVCNNIPVIDKQKISVEYSTYHSIVLLNYYFRRLDFSLPKIDFNAYSGGNSFNELLVGIRISTSGDYFQAITKNGTNWKDVISIYDPNAIDVLKDFLAKTITENYIRLSVD